MLHDDHEQFQPTQCQLPLQCRLLRKVIHECGDRLNVAIKPVLGKEISAKCNKSISSSPNLQIDFALGMDYSKETLEAAGPKRDMIKSQIQEDYAKADIYFQSLNVQTIAQEKKYSVQPVKQM